MKIAILGFGKQGKSALQYWNKPGNEITVLDSQQVEVPVGIKTKFGGDYLYDLHVYDLLVRSPGLHPQNILDNNINHPETMKKVTTVTNEFFRVCPAPIIAVTGTKGKGTTSTLIAKILEAAGHRTHLGGNIGIPPLELLANNIAPTDWVVLELANFQTIDLNYSPHIGVCLMITAEHLDWHHDMYEYVQAKERLFAHQTPNNYAIYNSLNAYSEEIADSSKAHKLSYEVPPTDKEEPLETNGAYVLDNHIYMQGHKLCSVHDVKLIGRHNLENICAAIAATWTIVGNQPELYKAVFQAFTGLEHRLETVAIYNDITYVNDSFGTTPQTAIVAIHSFKHPKVMILGGSDKGVGFDELAKEVVKGNVKHVLGIGATGPKIVNLIKARDTKKKIATTIMAENVKMPEIVETATKLATKGDVVMLSPGCASFGMFDNYEQRGQLFKQAVLAHAPPVK
jgi:UDP-N-acetylmuramoylalanine--D-glutamate ligase